MPKILVFGDSIIWGAFDFKKGGWVERLKIEYFKTYESKGVSVYNFGISNNDTNGVLYQLEEDIKKFKKIEPEELIIMFSIGSNDSSFVHSENNFKVLPDKFKENIQKLIKLARKFSSKIIFVGLTPVDELKTNPIPWATGLSYKNENIQKYNNIIKSVCVENNIHFIEIFDNFMKSDYQNLLEDGLHSNSKGHKKIFETVKDFLIKNKII